MTRESAYCFAADLGGTKLAAAMADSRGRIVAELTEPTDGRGGAYVAEQIATCADKLAQAAGIEVTRTRHVMVGVPGAIDPRTGRVSALKWSSRHIFTLCKYNRCATLGMKGKTAATS